MIVVHHLNNSRSQRVLWLLEELGLPYEVKRYERDPATLLAPAELKAVHPLGKAPVVVDGDKTLAETGAIVEQLLDLHDGEGRLRPSAGTTDFERYRYWLHYAEGSAMSLMLVRLIADRIGDAPASFLVRPVLKSISKTLRANLSDPQLTIHLDYWESELGKAEWFAGDAFTAADVMMSFPLEVADARAGLGERPRVADWLRRIHARPAYQRALERGGPYELLA